MASTRSPTSTVSESLNARNGSFSPLVSIFSTARSVRSSASTTFASNSRRSASATRNLLAALDDVVVGDDEPVRIDDDAGAERLLHALARHAEAETVAEETLEERIVEERRRGLRLHDALGIDVDHGGRDALHHRGIGERDLRRSVRQHASCVGPRGPRKEGERASQHRRAGRHREPAREGRLLDINSTTMKHVLGQGRAAAPPKEGFCLPTEGMTRSKTSSPPKLFVIPALCRDPGASYAEFAATGPRDKPGVTHLICVCDGPNEKGRSGDRPLIRPKTKTYAVCRAFSSSPSTKTGPLNPGPWRSRRDRRIR